MAQGNKPFLVTKNNKINNRAKGPKAKTEQIGGIYEVQRYFWEQAELEILIVNIELQIKIWPA